MYVCAEQDYQGWKSCGVFLLSRVAVALKTSFCDA